MDSLTSCVARKPVDHALLVRRTISETYFHDVKGFINKGELPDSDVLTVSRVTRRVEGNKQV